MHRPIRLRRTGWTSAGILRFLEERNIRDLDDVTEQLAVEFLRSLHDAGLSPRSVTREFLRHPGVPQVSAWRRGHQAEPDGGDRLAQACAHAPGCPDPGGSGVDPEPAGAIRPGHAPALAPRQGNPRSAVCNRDQGVGAHPAAAVGCACGVRDHPRLRQGIEGAARADRPACPALDRALRGELQGRACGGAMPRRMCCS